MDSILSLGLMQILRHSRSPPLAVSDRSVPASEEARSLSSSTLPSSPGAAPTTQSDSLLPAPTLVSPRFQYVLGSGFSSTFGEAC